MYRRAVHVTLVLALGALAGRLDAQQQQLVLSQGLAGTHLGVSSASSPTNGNVLAVWYTADADGSNRTTLWASLLKHGKSGAYKAGPRRQIASGGTVADPVQNYAAQAIWAPGMKNFFVVWQAEQADGSSEIWGRIIKAKTGKPKGGAKLLAGGGAFNSSPQVDATLVGGKHQGVVAYLSQTLPARAAVGQTVYVRSFKKNGKAAGAQVATATLDAEFASLSGVALSDADPGARERASFHVLYEGPFTDPENTEVQVCRLRTVRADSGAQIAEVEVPCGVWKPRRRVLGGEYLHIAIYERTGLVNVPYSVYAIDPSGAIAFEDQDALPIGQDPWELVDALEPPTPPERVSPSTAGGEHTLLARWSAGLQVFDFAANGSSVRTYVSPVSGALRDAKGEIIDGQLVVAVWIGSVNSGDAEEVRASIVELQ